MAANRGGDRRGGEWPRRGVGMAFRSLGSLVRGSMRARSCFSSPGIAVEEAMGSAASGEADRLRSLVICASHPRSMHAFSASGS